MYNTSDAYKRAVRANMRQDNLVGSITFKDGKTQDITTRDIDEGSVSISKKCTDGESLAFGGVFLGELEIGIRTTASRYAFYGAVISLTYQVKLDDGSWEDLPLGKYIVTDAEKQNTLVQLVAYDNLQLLDIPYGDTVLGGTPFQILEAISVETGIALGFSNIYIEDWSNASEVIQIDNESGCNTFRDALKIVCQLLGCFAYADRTGNLMLGRFQTENTFELFKRDRYKLTVADYNCQYIALSINSMKGEFVAYSEDTTEFGLTMNIDDAPAWDYGLDEILQKRTDSLFNYLKTINYTPSNIEMPGDPSIDCGDRILLHTDDGDVATLITEYEWKFHNTMSISSKGINPYIEGSTSGVSSSSRNLQKDIENSKVATYIFKNYYDVEVQDNKTELIADCDLAAYTETNAIFFANIKLSVEVPDVITEKEETFNVPIKVIDNTGAETTILDANGKPLSFSGESKCKHIDTTPGYTDITITYMYDQKEVEYKPQEHLTNGEHNLALIYPIPNVTTKVLHNWKIFITANGGKVTIPMQGLQAVIFGQGLSSGKADWDGTFDIQEFVDNLPLVSMNVSNSVNDIVTVESFEPHTSTITEKVSNIPLVGMAISNVDYTFGVNPVVVQQTVNFNLTDFTVKDDSIRLKTEYLYTGMFEVVNEGTLSKVTAIVTDKQSVSEIEVQNEL